MSCCMECHRLGAKLEQLRELHAAEIRFPENRNVPEAAVELIRAMMRVDHRQRPGYGELMRFEFVSEEFMSGRGEVGRVSVGGERGGSSILGEKNVQEILLGFDKRKNQLMQLRLLKEYYFENAEMISLILKFSYATFLELYGDAYEILNIYQDQETLAKQLQLLVTEILEILYKISEETENMLINRSESFTDERLCNALKEESQQLMKNADQDSIAFSTMISYIGMAYFPNESYFSELCQHAMSFQII